MASDIIAAALHAPFRSFEEAEDYLEDIAERSGVSHLSYWHIDIEQGELDDVVWLSTYDHHYTSAYMRNYTPLGDPVIARLIAGDDYVDWRDHQPENPVDDTLHNAANRLGISINGFSVGFQVQPNKLMVFSVSSFCHDVAWSDRIHQLRERFSAFALQFNHRMGPLLRSRQKDAWLMAV